jgi:hypothetical protein
VLFATSASVKTAGILFGSLIILAETAASFNWNEVAMGLIGLGMAWIYYRQEMNRLQYSKEHGQTYNTLQAVVSNVDKVGDKVIGVADKVDSVEEQFNSKMDEALRVKRLEGFLAGKEQQRTGVADPEAIRIAADAARLEKLKAAESNAAVKAADPPAPPAPPPSPVAQIAPAADKITPPVVGPSGQAIDPPPPVGPPAEPATRSHHSYCTCGHEQGAHADGPCNHPGCRCKSFSLRRP